MCFIGENAIEENILYTLSALWLSRDVVLRAAILQLLAGLTVSPRAAIELVQGNFIFFFIFLLSNYFIIETRNTKTGNGIWETALTILIDHEEASIARENAATLLGNLASHTNSSGNHVTLIRNLTPITVKKVGVVKVCISILKGDHNSNNALGLISNIKFLSCDFLLRVTQNN